MDGAYTILKNSLQQAARAANANLEDLIEIPDNAEEIITMFSSALTLEQIKRNENF